MERRKVIAGVAGGAAVVLVDFMRSLAANGTDAPSFGPERRELDRESSDILVSFDRATPRRPIGAK